MRLRATVSVRNDAMIAARRKRGWGQRELAAAAGVPLSNVGKLERLDYTFHGATERALAVAVALEIHSDDVMPIELDGVALDTTRTSVADVPTDRLLGAIEGGQAYLPNRSSGLSEEKRAELRGVLGRIMSALSYREREILKLRFGLTDGFEYSLVEVAEIFSVTRERVRQVEGKALQKLRHPVYVGQIERAVEDMP